MERVREALQRQSTACLHLGSPFNALVLRLLAEHLDDKTSFGRRILGWTGNPVADALALRAAGGLHALARSGRDPDLTAAYPPGKPSPDALWQCLAAAIEDHDAFLSGYLDSAPQTNEVKRSAALLGGCHLVAARTGLPLSILEIGSSAGLNLGLDRYRYKLGPLSWGDPESPVGIECDWRGAIPPLQASLAIHARRGCDLNPLDPALPAARERLLSYIWPDQSDRLAVTKAALAVAADAPWRVERADAGAWIEERLMQAPTEGQARVIVHTIVWQYLPKTTQSRIANAIRAAGEHATASAPVAWLRMEPDSSKNATALHLTLWPEGEERFLGSADYHGRWVDWA